ncbi:crotonase/enoyl-CoA hydratase family protein [soil metagenome]
MAGVTTPGVRTERLDRVLVMHLDDGKANALSVELIAAIRAELDAADNDPDVGAVVLHGREGRFCAGFDLGVMSTGDVSAISTLVSDGGDLVRSLYGSGVPVVAACTGHAVAAGALLLLGCDLRLGADVPAKIGLNEVAIKMVLPPWAITIAAERLSRRHLQRSLATARLTGPADAVDAGFLDEVVSADELLDVAVARAGEMAATLDRRAYAGTVRSLRGAVLDTMERQIAADRQSGSAPTL